LADLVGVIRRERRDDFGKVGSFGRRSAPVRGDKAALGCPHTSPAVVFVRFGFERDRRRAQRIGRLDRHQFLDAAPFDLEVVPA
jgi:hypothetical protein